jgi:signal transduction histidine kinase
MKRTLIVIVLAVAALALLVGAALKSRSVPLATHVAQYSLAADIDRFADDYRTLVASLGTAWRSSRIPGEAASALHRRVVDSAAAFAGSIAGIPGSAQQRARMENSLLRLEDSMATADALATRLLAQQTAYASNLSFLRERGPEVVRELRDTGRTRLATNVFELIAESIEFADPAADPDGANLRRLLVTLNRDANIDTSLPADLGPLLAGSSGLLETRSDTESRLNQLGNIRLVENAEALGLAATAAYQNAVASADRASTMLSVYAVVMLLAVGVIAFRLQGSYRQLNSANEALGELNESLEQRVEERTLDLSNALEELKESQVQLVQAEKMSSLGQLVAGISHEINTPLLYLANNASMIAERIESLNDFVHRSAHALAINPAEFENRSEYTRQLIEGLRTLKILLRENELEAAVEDIVDLNADSIEGLKDLTTMAQSLKDFSRLDRAPVDSFDVNAGIDKTLTIARNTLKHKAEVRKFYGELPPIECSPSKINQVFLNLITNAAQAIEDTGEIVISTRTRDTGHVLVSISDTGCGIPEENLAKIRDPFFTTKEVGAGTGLGLSIVDEIIRSHGGELLIESKLGVGSTFSVVLPVRQASPAAVAGTGVADTQAEPDAEPKAERDAAPDVDPYAAPESDADTDNNSLAAAS